MFGWISRSNRLPIIFGKLRRLEQYSYRYHTARDISSQLGSYSAPDTTMSQGRLYTDGLQRAPPPEGFTKEELDDWRKMLIGRRITINGQGTKRETCLVILQACHDMIDGRYSGSDHTFALAWNEIQLESQAEYEARHENTSDNDFDTRDLPKGSLVLLPWRYSPLGNYRPDRLRVKVGLQGLVVNVYNG